jgi:hypothetical protein
MSNSSEPSLIIEQKVDGSTIPISNFLGSLLLNCSPEAEEGWSQSIKPETAILEVKDARESLSLGAAILEEYAVRLEVPSSSGEELRCMELVAQLMIGFCYRSQLRPKAK